MRTPAFWYKRPGKRAALLSPFGYLYSFAGHLRRTFAKPYRAPVPVICVGNIVAGGAGKTPTVLAIVDLLRQQGATPAVVLRGYGGSEKGPLRVDPALHTADQVGDEALLLAQAAPCWIGRNRAKTVAQASTGGITHVIMDDGLQNPTVVHDLSLLVLDGASGIGNEHLFPAGPLRETLNDALDRITAVVMIGKDSHNLTAQLRNKPVIHAELEPRLPSDFPKDHSFLAFSGIARPEKFFSSCHALSLNISETVSFADHHPFTANELSDLLRQAEQTKSYLLTTKKDWVRLPDAFRNQTYVLPVELVFSSKDILSALFQSATVADRLPS